MLPTIAIIGRPNVGKSTLFNYVTRNRQVIIADYPGVTRDRIYAEAKYEDQPFILVDTGGIEPSTDPMQNLVSKQALQAAQEADVIWFVVDARANLTAGDSAIAEQLRLLSKPIFIVVNKTDGLDATVVASEFYELGFAQLFSVAATQGRGVSDLLSESLAPFEIKEDAQAEEAEQVESNEIKVAVIGRPNVGKSTLVNRILGEERVLVFDRPGTTRDSILIPFERRDVNYILIDTAGVRRKRSISESLEKFSVIKTLQAVAMSNVVVFVFDAQEGITEQDLHLLGFVLEAGKGLVIAVNKWDDLPQDQKDYVKKEIDRRLQFISFAQIHFISALHGSGVGDLFESINKSYRSAMAKFPTPELTEILEFAVSQHQPPLVKGRRIKLRYAHQGGTNPPVIVIHGNQTQSLADSYRRYLINFFREKLRLVGTPIHIVLKTGDNPYEGRRNILTPRQKHRRQRLMKHVKKKK